MEQRWPISNSQVNKAGDVLREDNPDIFLEVEAVDLVARWRATFSGPLRSVTAILRRATIQINRGAVVSNRLKRMDSITAKLKRPQTATLKLASMQDIAGCRAVMWPIGEVHQMMAKYSRLIEQSPNSISDYIQRPKPDGYRGIHFVVRYTGKNRKFAGWVGKNIEVQIRSTLQHAWATAVETVDLFTGQRLKFGAGDPRWRRFFALASTVFAKFENSPLVPNTPADDDEIRKELYHLRAELNVVDLLQGWATAAGHLPEVLKGETKLGLTPASMFILMVNLDEANVYINPYSPERIEEANKEYAFLEESIRNGKHSQVVLVSVEDVEQLRTAFPNFYADTGQFLRSIEEFISRYDYGNLTE
jgi:hypothetical protein